MKKLKTYVLTVRTTFPVTHPRKGDQTYFVEKIQKALGMLVELPGDAVIDLDEKRHTVRANYEYWEKCMKEVQAGRAIISLRYWKGKPRQKGSKLIEFATLNKDSGCGVQKIHLVDHGSFMYSLISNPNQDPHIHSDCVDYKEIKHCIGLNNTIAVNDGLTYRDFKAWFKGYDFSKSMAVIHFTKFRY